MAPIVYEDFLPKSAAGIFASNLTSDGTIDATREAAARDARWMQDVLGRTLHDPYALYEAERLAGSGPDRGAEDVTGFLR
ncbi:2-oxoadipate dioxygenase/decarboxylase family protein [Aeromicrobium sp. UC242_57]|uniref:2-oxoadipate dioxygenase/decarboxylase family protein n=1 Tax=Aeromicrobium sp. UC242_57 TaxID=3374624 RepID=UPI0037A91423